MNDEKMKIIQEWHMDQVTKLHTLMRDAIEVFPIKEPETLMKSVFGVLTSAACKYISMFSDCDERIDERKLASWFVEKLNEALFTSINIRKGLVSIEDALDEVKERFHGRGHTH